MREIISGDGDFFSRSAMNASHFAGRSTPIARSALSNPPAIAFLSVLDQCCLHTDKGRTTPRTISVDIGLQKWGGFSPPPLTRGEESYFPLVFCSFARSFRLFSRLLRFRSNSFNLSLFLCWPITPPQYDQMEYMEHHSTFDCSDSQSVITVPAKTIFVNIEK